VRVVAVCCHKMELIPIQDVLGQFCHPKFSPVTQNFSLQNVVIVVIGMWLKLLRNIDSWIFKKKPNKNTIKLDISFLL
jgi:hypothetical protein